MITALPGRMLYIQHIDSFKKNNCYITSIKVMTVLYVPLEEINLLASLVFVSVICGTSPALSLFVPRQL